jgi:hypothetical protein
MADGMINVNMGCFCLEKGVKAEPIGLVEAGPYTYTMNRPLAYLSPRESAATFHRQ